MSRTSTSTQSRPGWAIPSEDSLPRRRWRILRTAKPRMGPVGPMTHWIKTPEDFVHWLASQLNLSELHTYFRDLEAIAKMSCDLELLRFARRYLASDLVREFASKRERLQELFPEGTHFATAPDSAAKRDQRSANR